MSNVGIKEEKVFGLIDRGENRLVKMAKFLADKPDSRYKEMRAVDMKRDALKDFKHRLLLTGDLDEEKIFSVLNELDEKFKDEKKPAGLNKESGSLWRRKMKDYAAIRDLLWELRNMINEVYRSD